ncbi:hypothetical protein RND71_042156 [Anisodus tanguticus]|uniref:Protein kinase domain-containing protein n=1 Tax=Anisodus tanguticus TaxID=243964 RepID=A0AAE1QR13_9SOLA|nr:hypothetical protein RND71_042156 [Anisodus tanguticus]
MGIGILGSFLVLTVFFRPLLCQQSNTDGFFVSDFLQKMGFKSTKDHNFSAHFCSWQGVGCDAKAENVVNLTANSFGLSGVIPDNTIGKLTKLQFLDLSNNKLTGLPSDIWSLGSLMYLNLSHNKISGELSSNIGNFGVLEILDLSVNNFSGKIPEAISSLSSVHILNVSRNQFDSEIPSGILSCHSLESLDVSENRLSGLPNGFGSAFPKLKFLNLAENEILGKSSDFSRMDSITHINISGNMFKGSVVGLFEGPLEVIDLSRNQFDGHISKVNFSSSFNWSHLVYLDLSENQLSGEIFSELNNAQSLLYLNLADNRFSQQEFPTQIDMLFSLEYLNLSGTSLIGQIPQELSSLSRLKVLDISKNRLSNRIPLLSNPNLLVLDVSYNNLTGDIPLELIEKLPRMERFNFSYNNLTLCASEFSSKTLQSVFIGSSNGCPIAANPALFHKKGPKHRGFKLALSLTFSMVFLLLGLLFLAFGCRRKTTIWAVKQNSYKEEQTISGPFSFQTDSTTWVADVKQANSVPVVIIEKPLLNFTFTDLLSATSNFDRGTLLAEGRFGPVYRGFLPGGIHVAVKVLVHGSTMTDHEAARELEYLGRIKHPNLVPLTGYCLAGEQRIAIYDYMENGNLQNLLHDLPLGVLRTTTEDWSTDTWEVEDDDNNIIQNVGSEGLLTTWRFRHKIALGTARALAFLHHGCSPPIIHRDVKASSVYLDMNLEPRLSDFGLAKIFGTGPDDEITRGLPGYIPPEFLHPESSSPKYPTPKSDVYGFGVILFELITGRKPVEDDYPEDKDGNLVGWVRGLVRKNEGSRVIDPKIRGTASETQILEALKIGYLCTAEVPAKRPSMHQVVGLLKDIEPAQQ